MFMPFSGRLLPWALCAAMLAAPTASAETPVALTFDDLPSHGPLPAGMSRVDIVRGVVTVLQREKAPPVYGFVNGIALNWDPAAGEALRLWRSSGNLLGNHTYSHLDPDKGPAGAFLADIAADEPVLKEYMAGADWHWLRLPFLRDGDTADKRAAIETYLAREGYRIADVTMAFNDYDYNPAYARCLAKNDAKAIAWMKVQYLKSAGEAFDYGRLLSQKAFGREIPHVYLLHIGAFDSLMFPDFIRMLKDRHARLIPLDTAQGDPVYARFAARQSWGGTLIPRAMVASGIVVPPAPAGLDDTAAALAKLCP